MASIFLRAVLLQVPLFFCARTYPSTTACRIFSLQMVSTTSWSSPWFHLVCTPCLLCIHTHPSHKCACASSIVHLIRKQAVNCCLSGNAYYNISECKDAGNTSLRWYRRMLLPHYAQLTLGRTRIRRDTGYLTTARRCTSLEQYVDLHAQNNVDFPLVCSCV